LTTVQQSQARLKILLLLFGLALGLAAGRFFVFKSESTPKTDTGKPGLNSKLDPYGPKHFSEGDEAVLIRHYFKDRKDGFFLDVGAYHYRNRAIRITWKSTWVGGE